MVAAPVGHRPALERFYTIDRLRPLQAALKGGLGMLFETPPAGVRPRNWSNKLNTTEKLIRDLDGNMVLETENAGDLMAAFGSQVFRTLLAVSPRLRRCADPKCGRVFLATRRQQFCNYQHASRVRMRRLREKWDAQKKSEESDRLHGAYLKKQQARHGPKVKVTPRGPRKRKASADGRG
jgi:hypothetical protein